MIGKTLSRFGIMTTDSDQESSPTQAAVLPQPESHSDSGRPSQCESLDATLMTVTPSRSHLTTVLASSSQDSRLGLLAIAASAHATSKTGASEITGSLSEHWQPELETLESESGLLNTMMPENEESLAHRRVYSNRCAEISDSAHKTSVTLKNHLRKMNDLAGTDIDLTTIPLDHAAEFMGKFMDYIRLDTGIKKYSAADKMLQEIKKHLTKRMLVEKHPEAYFLDQYKELRKTQKRVSFASVNPLD